MVSDRLEVQRGEIWWADLPEARGSEPAFRRPVLIIQADSFNRSGIQTVVVAAITSNLQLADAPGNVRLPTRLTPHERLSRKRVTDIDSRPRLFGRVYQHSTQAAGSLLSTRAYG